MVDRSTTPSADRTTGRADRPTRGRSALPVRCVAHGADEHLDQVLQGDQPGGGATRVDGPGEVSAGGAQDGHRVVEAFVGTVRDATHRGV